MSVLFSMSHWQIEEWPEEMMGPDNNISNKTQGTCLYLLSGHEIPHELNV